jgi:hypothetical protein
MRSRRTARTFYGLPRALAAALLGAGSLAAVANPGTCELELPPLSVRVTATDNGVEVSTTEDAALRSRMDVPLGGPLKGCWALDVDGDGHPELLLSAAVAEAGTAPALQAWRWTGEWFESLALAPMDVSPPLPATSVEHLELVAGELVRSFRATRDGSPLAHFRYDREAGRWVPLQALRTDAARRPKVDVDSLLQAPADTKASP